MPQSRKRQPKYVSVRITPETWKRAKIEAAHRGMSLIKFLAVAVSILKTHK